MARIAIVDQEHALEPAMMLAKQIHGLDVVGGIFGGREGHFHRPVWTTRKVSTLTVPWRTYSNPWRMPIINASYDEQSSRRGSSTFLSSTHSVQSIAMGRVSIREPSMCSVTEIRP